MIPSIFQVGARYKVKRDFLSGFDNFSKGEILTYVGSGFVPYDGRFTYDFRTSGGVTKTWWLGDRESPSTWKEYFSSVGLFG